MKRIIDLNEEDIKRIVLRVIKEQDTDNKSGFEAKLQDAFKATTSGLKDFMDQLTGRSTGEEESSDTESSEVNVSAKGQELLNNPTFKKKLKEISDAIKVDEKSIIKLMKHESGLNPSIKNRIGCVGLIQFCPGGGRTKTVNGKTYTIDELGNNLEAQMDAIKDFWSKGYQSGKIKSAADLYIYNFFPVAAGKPDDFVLQAKGLPATTVAQANPGFNKKLGKPTSSPLTVGDLKKYYRITGMV
jgi:hypothetical protein